MTAVETQEIDRAMPPTEPSEPRCDVCGRPETHDNPLMTCAICCQLRCKRCSTQVERKKNMCRGCLPPEVAELITALEVCKAESGRLARSDLPQEWKATGAWRKWRLEGMGI